MIQLLCSAARFVPGGHILQVISPTDKVLIQLSTTQRIVVTTSFGAANVCHTETVAWGPVTLTPHRPPGLVVLPKAGMVDIPVATLYFLSGGNTIWVADHEGGPVLTLQSVKGFQLHGIIRQLKMTDDRFFAHFQVERQLDMSITEETGRKCGVIDGPPKRLSVR